MSKYWCASRFVHSKSCLRTAVRRPHSRETDCSGHRRLVPPLGVEPTQERHVGISTLHALRRACALCVHVRVSMHTGRKAGRWSTFCTKVISASVFQEMISRPFRLLRPSPRSALWIWSSPRPCLKDKLRNKDNWRHRPYNDVRTHADLTAAVRVRYLHI